MDLGTRNCGEVTEVRLERWAAPCIPRVNPQKKGLETETVSCDHGNLKSRTLDESV